MEKELTIKQFFGKMLSSNSAVSSKRFCGLIGGIFCIVLALYCTGYDQQAPDIVDMLFICSTSLLGIDSITNIGKKNVNK